MAEREEGRTRRTGNGVPAQWAHRYGGVCRSQDGAGHRAAPADRYEADAAWLCEAERYAVLGED